jgi:hypothetical protein
MELSGLHLLLTYECNLQCDHCFTWGSPWNHGTMTIDDVRTILGQTRGLGTVESVYFEGGEPFLYYPILVEGVKEALRDGFKVGIVSNGYWATAPEDARLWLQPLASRIKGLSISMDALHWEERLSPLTENARGAAEELQIPVEVITILRHEEPGGCEVMGQLRDGKYYVMHRGRAVEKLLEGLPRRSWKEFEECPYEDLRDPRRVHVDQPGHVHICQGISIGNIFQSELVRICEGYEPESNPITGPLLEGGPAELVRQYGVDHEESYVDACHLCYVARVKLRNRFPEILTPDQMYGVIEEV